MLNEVSLNYYKKQNITIQKKPILIIANGKSAGKLNWDWLKKNSDKVDTFSMNSAYKLYEKLDFYPTYYANMDDVVVVSHKKKLQDLLDKKRIKKCFYLRWWHYMKYHDSMYKFNENETYVPIKKNNLPYKLSSDTNNFSSWSNTGSDCVQLAIMMGYRDIYIVGVDGYVEKIKEAQEVIKNGRKTFVIKETPEDNPNYFFKEYQEKGDEYNPPNASTAHVPGWRTVTNYCKIMDINVLNMSNPNYIKSIPFIDYDTFTKNIENNNKELYVSQN